MSSLSSNKFKESVRRIIAVKKVVHIDKDDLAKRKKILYPWIEKLINIASGRADYDMKNSMPGYKTYNDDIETVIEYIPFLMFCIKKLTENYISKMRSPISEWQAIAVAALLLSWKSYGVDENIEISPKQLSLLCSGGCSESKIRALEIAIIKLENYIICGGGISGGYHPPEGPSLNTPFPEISEPVEIDEINLKLEREIMARDEEEDKGWQRRLIKETERARYEKIDSDDD